ncbi:hypothetical protein TRFO_04762 [Tritrichomonas foetus]|uniref:Uncharacterized protein n=1 Tax=Tritrichomonas foetus TaxID=1144522 RepID=A0A1J4KFY4_9EUKA|nr:hypothetical protein TRFO_04762 [Tritrichomonas foetus]|eukprot:OHT08692.1 hypothetical protein TRFO_04762 [Tritrichomonas foetus]
MNSEFSRPSPYVYGCHYCDNIIKNGLKNANPAVLSDQLIAIILNTDLTVISHVLGIFFKIIDSNFINSKQLQSLRQIVKIIVSRFQDQSQFRNIVVQFFDNLPSFPEKSLSSLFDETSLTLTIFCCLSNHSKEATNLLTTKLLPNLNNSFFISNELLYQLCSLNIPNVDLSKLTQGNRSFPLQLSPYTQGNNKYEVMKLESSQIAVPLYSVIMEYDSCFLSSKSHVEQLFDFYSNFNEKHAATFILSIVAPESNFKEYLEKLDSHQRLLIFNMYKEIFVRRKINFTKLVDALDVIDFPPISSDSCYLLFLCICCFFDKQLIPSSSFTRRWRNKKLQFSILSAMTTFFIPNLDFSKGGPQVNLHQLEMQLNVFKQWNNCWVSLEFTERIVSLMITNRIYLERYLDPLINKYPALLIALLGQTNVRITEELIDVILSPFIKVLQGSQSILAVLWKLANPFMNRIIAELYIRQPARIETIFESANKMLDSLLLHEDVAFATDLAFYAASQNKLEIGDFVTNYVNKYTISSLTKIMDFIKQRMTESLPSTPPFQTAVLNSLFTYLYNKFDSYPTEIRAFIQRTFMTCETVRPDIKHFTFDLKIPISKLHEIKQTASMNYSMLLEDELTVLELADMIEKYRTTDPTLFSCHIHYLLAEFRLLCKHAAADVEKLAGLAGTLVTSNALSSKQIEMIFPFIRHALSQPPSSSDFLFATTALEAALPKLSDFPQFVYDVMHESQLRSYKPSLYDKVHKIGQALNEPIQSSRTTVLHIHPKLKRYEQISSPPPRVCKAIQSIQADPSSLPTLLENFPLYRDWIAYHIVCIIQDTPELLNPLLTHLLENKSFLTYVFQASASQAHQHILSPDFDKYEGGFVRRRLLILGKLIGSITLAINRPLLSRFLDLKQILLYAFSQGKLYGIVPFVCAILAPASKYFALPNPFTSSILQILAAIYSANNIKLVIKNNIDEIFGIYNTTLSRFASIPLLFPEKRQNNFDFLMCPFSLQHAVAPPDVERILNFDETAFSQFVSQLIIIPDHPILTTKPELKDKMRRILIQQSLHLIRSEGMVLSRVASSTAQTLSLKDFMLYSDNELLLEQAQTLTKQLSAGLTLFTIPVKVSRQLLTCLKHESEGADNDWVESIAQQNYEWIVQLLRDVVRLRAWKSVHKAVENSDDVRLQMQKSAKTLGSYSISMKQAYYGQMQQIYNDMSELSLSVQPFPTFESLQAKERMVPTDMEFDQYLQKFQKVTQYGTAYDIPEDVNIVIQQCPDLSGKTIVFERFKAILKTLLKNATKSINTPFEPVIVRIIDKVCQSVPHSLVTKAQSYVLTWVKNPLHSFLVIGELLECGLLTIQQLDITLTEMLNSEPFNPRGASFVTQLLFYLIVRQNIVSPASVISSLSALTVCKNGLQADNSHSNSPQPQQNVQVMKQLDELINLYNTMEAPSHQLSAASKLQTVSTFDPIEDMDDSDSIIFKLKQWCDSIDSPKPTEENVLKATMECVNSGKNFFVYLFFCESERTSLQFLQCAERAGELKNKWCEMLDAVVMIIQGNANVVGFDMRKFYTIFRAMMDPAIQDPNLLIQYLVSLHKTRPLLMPSFSFSWIELITDKQLVYTLLSNPNNWPSYSILITDFCTLVAQLDNDSSNDVFNQVYRSFLRILLILVHDFRDFIVAIQSMLLMSLPFSFCQARNIILSVTPQTDVQPLKTTEDLLSTLSPNIVSLLKTIVDNGGFYDEISFKSVIDIFNAPDENKNNSFSRSFIALITAPLSSLKQSDAIEETAAYSILSSVLDAISPETAMAIINLLVDRLRFDCRETNAFIRLIFTLFKAKLYRSGICEIIVRVIFERASAPPPRPFGLITIVKELIIDNDRNNTLLSLPISTPNESVTSFLTAAKSIFFAKK